MWTENVFFQDRQASFDILSQAGTLHTAYVVDRVGYNALSFANNVVAHGRQDASSSRHAKFA